MTKIGMLLAGVVLIVIPPGTHAQKALKSVTMGNGSLALSAAEISQYKGEALDGSATAAVKLADYYEAIALDPNRGLYWLQIAAENGDIGAMHSYWVIASQSEDSDDRRRGIYWLKKASSLGDKVSQEALRKELHQ